VTYFGKLPNKRIGSAGARPPFQMFVGQVEMALSDELVVKLKGTTRSKN
jgi:hypothetical protein